MDLKLSEKLLLLAVDDEKGTMVSDQIHLHYSLAGALILEMTLSERIGLIDDRVVLQNSGATKDPIINEIIALIQKSSKRKKINYWVSKIGQKGGKFQKETINNLISKGILRKQEDKILWIIPYNKYPTVNAKPENEIRRELRDIVLHGQQPNQENLMLLGLTQASNLIKEIFPNKEHRKTAKIKIKELTSESKVSKAVDSAIEGVQAAVMVAVMSATVAATAATSASH